MTNYDEYGMPVGYEELGFVRQALRLARAFTAYRILPLLSNATRRSRNGRSTFRALFTLVNVVIATWFITLHWGERSVFGGSIGSCKWDNWENWPSGATPHRLVFVADPQLVDPHTYPDRPWPLSTLTVKHTDLYLRRTYSRIQRVLYPDTVIFLGDLFDGGREWSTYTTTSPEEQWRKYGEEFWLKEYERFGGIFFDHWGDGGTTPRYGQPGRKIISSLPGNHDLGFGRGIQSSVRQRFNAYFGDGNRIDIVGNHTFVSVDTVSLSAMGQENAQSNEEIWKPAVEFLENVQANKKRLVTRELRAQQGLPPYLRFSHEIIAHTDFPKAELPRSQKPVTEFPTILLSHVPLYRPEGTPCGPLREHWPPTPPPKGQKEALEKDDRNAIAVRGGYQYQNVLAKEITMDLTEKVGNIQYAFSGDDHDYCEVVHRGYPSAGGGIREITVKSISWAMGVRKPGVVMLSLWNPVDTSGNPLNSKGDIPSTLQSHLCLLPDQLGIFIRYATLFGLTIFALMVRAGLIASGYLKANATGTDAPILPVTEQGSSAENEKAALHARRNGSDDEASSASSASSNRGQLQIRSANARTRSVSPGGYGLPATQSNYTYPLVQHAGYCPEEDGQKETKKWDAVDTNPKRRHRKVTKLGLFFQEFSHSVLQVASLVFLFYFWLIWKG